MDALLIRQVGDGDVDWGRRSRSIARCVWGGKQAASCAGLIYLLLYCTVVSLGLPVGVTAYVVWVLFSLL